MRLTFEDLIQYDEPMDIPVKPLGPLARRRIAGRVRAAIHPPRRSPARPVRRVLIAAAALAALSATAFAAYSGGWFGFDRIFGGKTAIVADHVQNYAPPEQAGTSGPAVTVEAIPDPGAEERERMEQGFLALPNVARADPETATADTGSFRCRLESMMATPDTLMAVMRVDALTDEAKNMMQNAVTAQQAYENNLPLFMLLAENLSAGEAPEGHEAEYNNGGMSWLPLEETEEGAVFLLVNTGGRFREGDTIRFTCNDPVKRHFMLFDAEIRALMTDHVDLSLPAQGPAGLEVEQIRVTPISLQLRLTGEVLGQSPELSLTVGLQDGTVFDLTGAEGRVSEAGPGAYGSLAHGGAFGIEGDWAEYTWALSQLVEPGDVAWVTLNGVTFPAP